MSQPFFILRTSHAEYHTGCIAPASPAVFAHVPVFEQNVTPWTESALKDYCASRERVRSRERFAKLIRSQGRRGSCNGYAGAKAFERARLRRYLDWIEMSGEGLYCQINGGRDDGSQLVDGMNAIVNSPGVPRAADVPYEEYRKERVPAEAWARALRGFELYQIKSEVGLATALASGFDCVVAVHVTDSWTQLTAGGYVPAQNGPGNHAVGVDDVIYDTQRGTFAFDHFGSWGTDIHENGYALITWAGHLQTSNNYHGFYAIRSTLDN